MWASLEFASCPKALERVQLRPVGSSVEFDELGSKFCNKTLSWSRKIFSQGLRQVSRVK